MTLKEFEIWHSQEVAISNHPYCKGRRGKTWEETKRELNVTDKTITNTKRKTEYNAATQAMLEELHFGVREYAEGLIRKTKATRGVNIRVEPKADGAARVVKRIQEPDNATQFNALSEIGDIFGAKAPKQVDLKHTMAAMGDDELRDAVNQSAQEIEGNGRIQHQLALPLDAAANITTKVACAEQGVDVVAGEQTACPADN